MSREKTTALIQESNYISRDLSWLKFNYRVLDQVRDSKRSLFEKINFLAITASNLDEFFMIRVGSLYNYLDYNKQRFDFSGLKEIPFRDRLFEELQSFKQEQYKVFSEEVLPEFVSNGFRLASLDYLTEEENMEAGLYFKKTIFPMLTPMVFDSMHSFPMLMNKILIFGILTKGQNEAKELHKLSFVQIPQNLPRFFEIPRENELLFVPIEEIIRVNLHRLYRNVEISDISLFRITRNGDYTIEEDEDMESDFLGEMRRVLKTRKTGRVVRMEVMPNPSKHMIRLLKERWDLRDDNIFEVGAFLDFTGLRQIMDNEIFRDDLPVQQAQVTPVSLQDEKNYDLFKILRKKDILLHHPFNTMDPLFHLLERAADDPKVLAIKITIYRLAKNSQIVEMLLKAAENGKHVSVLFEVKARFDEENNMRQAKRLQEAGCFVIFGVSSLKTHSKLLLIVRKDTEKVTCFVHLSSGNYNETTSKFYTDIALLTTNEVYAHDVSEFFNVITGHSFPRFYEVLITAPRDMRNQLIELINKEAENARNGQDSGIVIKVNSLQDPQFIDALYAASKAGVKIKLLVRGICCVRPGRKGLSENIEIYSIVGDYLEHSRIFCFRNKNNTKVLVGSADAMARSFDRRIESLYFVNDPNCKQEVINILMYNLKDNVNAYKMSEDGSYHKIKPANGEAEFNSQKEFFKVTQEIIEKAKVF